MGDILLSYYIAQDLPFDILHEIFELCLPSVDNPPVDHQPNFTLAPLLLCHICVSWRTAALSMASLWRSTTFTLYTTRRHDPPSDRLLLRKTTQFIAWWKKNIGDVAPSLYLPWSSTQPGRRKNLTGLQDVHKALFDSAFFRSAHTLRLVIMNQELDIICSNPVAFPNLSQLRIESIQDSLMPRIEISSFPPSPLLSRIQISHAESFQERTLNIFPWAQLTHLYLPRTMTVGAWKALVQRCTNFKVVAVMLSGADSGGTDGAPVVVNNLRQLVAASNSMRTGIPFTGMLFPNLTAFRLISSFIAGRVRSLDVLEGLLSAMPALKELHLDSALSFTDEEYIPFDQARARSGRCLSTLLPNLQHLVIDFIDPSTDNVAGNIIRFLRSEWLCYGWDPLPQDYSESSPSSSYHRRTLKFIISDSSYVYEEPIPNEIVAEVSTFLHSEVWEDISAPFEVSIHEEELVKPVGRSVFDVFDEDMPSKGWDKAVDFCTPA
ncbi:hypothetical protein BDN70DRAFT_878319 [Pholiota conissans]|uniref:F-box domain-containing protein n=1 Tax=Pholiota conissans TaxID=109636 RepID=A0A9P5Z1U8_9AGAR|nr:hypothetical protein BDN70DRAFT_878319 [Pholiota conissans]